MKNALDEFTKQFGEGTAFDLDWGKLLIIGLLVYHIFFWTKKISILREPVMVHRYGERCDQTALDLLLIERAAVRLLTLRIFA